MGVGDAISGRDAFHRVRFVVFPTSRKGGLIRNRVEPVLTRGMFSVVAKESWIVGMKVVIWRNVPREAGSVSWITRMEVANVRSDLGALRSEVAMSILEVSIWRMKGWISI